MKTNKNAWAILLLALSWVGMWAWTARAGDRDVLATSAGTVLATSTDALSTAVKGGGGSYHYGITFAVITTASVVDLMVNDGVGTRTLKLNGGTSCTAGVIYRQELDFPGSWTMNVRVETLTTPIFAIVQEKNGR